VNLPKSFEPDDIPESFESDETLPKSFEADQTLPRAPFPGGTPRDLRPDVNVIVKRPRWDEFVDATATGLARVASAGVRVAAGIYATEPLPGYDYEDPFDTKKRKDTAKRLRDNSDLLWQISKHPDLAAQNTDLESKALRLIGETIPYISLTTLGYVAAGPAGGFVVGSLIEGNSAYRNALEHGLSEENAQSIGIGVGVISGAVEAFGGRYTEQLFLRASAKLQSKVVGGLTAFGIGTVVEALEEGAQEIAAITGESIYRDIDWNESVSRILGSMAGGAFLGGTMRVGGLAGRGLFGTQKQIAQEYEEKLSSVIKEGGPEALQRAKGVIKEGIDAIGKVEPVFGDEVTKAQETLSKLREDVPALREGAKAADIKSIEAQIAGREEEIQGALTTLVDAQTRALKEAQAQAEMVSERLKKIEAAKKAVPGLEKQLDSMTQELSDLLKDMPVMREGKVITNLDVVDLFIAELDEKVDSIQNRIEETQDALIENRDQLSPEEKKEVDKSIPELSMLSSYTRAVSSVMPRREEPPMREDKIAKGKKIAQQDKAIEARLDSEEVNDKLLAELKKPSKEKPSFAEATKEKEPWEMTRKEFKLPPNSAYVKSTTNKIFRGDNHLEAYQKMQRAGETEKEVRDSGWIVGDKLIRDSEASHATLHKEFIQQALSESKPVPRQVLEEYKSEKWAQEALAKKIKMPETASGMMPEEKPSFAKATNGKQAWEMTFEDKEGENPYLTMPIDVVQSHADYGVQAAKDALIELGEIEIKPASNAVKRKIINLSTRHGLDEGAFKNLLEYTTGLDSIDQATSEDADAMLDALTDYEYMDYGSSKTVTKKENLLIDGGLSVSGIKRIFNAAKSTSVYNKVINYSNLLGGAPTNNDSPDIEGRRRLWERELKSIARKAKKYSAKAAKFIGPDKVDLLNPYQSISYALDKAESKAGYPLRRLWSDIVAETKGYAVKNEQLIWDALKRAGVHRLGVVTNQAENSKIALWLDEWDDAKRANLWIDMKPKTRALASELENVLQNESARLVRWARFVKWDFYAKKGEKLLNDIRSKGEVPTDKQIKKANDLMELKRPFNAPRGALREGRIAKEMGQFDDWLDTQTWGTRKRYFMHETELNNFTDGFVEGSIPEEIFERDVKASAPGFIAPSATEARKGGSEVIKTRNASLAVLRQMDQLAAFASTFELRSNFWDAFTDSNPSKQDLHLMKEADASVRGIFHPTKPVFKVFRNFDRYFWRGYLVLNPSGSLWFAWRQALQNFALAPSQFSMTEVAKSVGMFPHLTSIKHWINNNPEAKESFRDFYRKNVSESRSFYRHFIMKSEEIGGLEMTSKAGTLIDMLAFTPALTDRANRFALWPIAYNIAERNLNLFKAGKLSASSLWNRLALNTVTPGQSLELQKLLDTEDYAKFMDRYAEYKVENVHFRYNPSLRGLQEMDPTGRVTMGLITFPRGVINIAWKNGIEPMMSGNPRKVYDGFKTLIKLIGVGTVGTFIADVIFDDDDKPEELKKLEPYLKLLGGTTAAEAVSKKVMGYGAYNPVELIFGLSILSPGFAKVYEMMSESRMIISSGTQEGLSSKEIGLRLAKTGSMNLEIFLPMAEVSIDVFNAQHDTEGAHIWSIARYYAMDEWERMYGTSFKVRDRTLQEKIKLIAFGREGKKEESEEERLIKHLGIDVKNIFKKKHRSFKKE